MAGATGEIEWTGEHALVSPQVRLPGDPRVLRTGQLVAVLLGVVLTLVTIVEPSTRLALYIPYLRPVLEVAGASIVLFAALILAVPRESDVRPAARNAFAGALTVLAVSNGLFGVLPVLSEAGLAPDRELAFYPWVAARYVISLLFICAGLERPRMGLARYLLFALGTLAGVELAVQLVSGRLLLPVQVFSDRGAPTVVVVSHLGHALLQVVPAALFGLGAWLAGRLYLRSAAPEHIWLSLALIAQVFAQLHEILYPAFLGPILTSADPLRFLSFLLLACGAFVQLARLYRSRYEAVHAQQADLHRQEALLDDLRRFAEHEHDFRTLVSHELATPIATIRAFAHVLEATAPDSLDPSGRQALEGIRGEANRLMELVARMEELRDLEVAGFRCELRPVRIRPLLEDASIFVQGVPGAHPVAIRCPDVRVEADPVRLGQALRNVLVNATRYSPPNSLVRIEGEVRSEGRFRISVSDEGPGIPGHERERVLRRYARGSSGRGVEGRGVGLYVASRIAEAHHGALRIKPGDGGRGTKVVIEVRTAS